MATKVKEATKLTPRRLSLLLRREKDPKAALSLFLSAPHPFPFPYTYLCYNRLLTKLAYSHSFSAMDRVLHHLRANTAVVPKEELFCTIISTYAQKRLLAPARDLFVQIPSFRCARTAKSFNTLLDAYLRCQDLERFEALWRSADSYGVSFDACSYNIYMRKVALSGGSVSRAWEVFGEMLKRGVTPSVVTFGTLIAVLCDNSMVGDALNLKERMVVLYSIKPSDVMYITLMKALCRNGELSIAFELKEEMSLDRDLGLNPYVYSILIRALFTSDRKGEVIGLYEEMKANGIAPNVMTFNSMIAGFCLEEKNFDAAFEVLDEMQRSGCKPDLISCNTIINGFCKVGRWRDARDLFEDMPRRGCKPDIVTYRALFDAIIMCDCKEFKEAIVLLDEMVAKGFTPGKNVTKTFLGGIMGKYDGLLVESFFCRYMKLNLLDLNSWKKLVSHLVV